MKFLILLNLCILGLSSKAQGLTFLEQLRDIKESVTISELELVIRELSTRTNEFLSLGETHLDRDKTLNVYKYLLGVYFENISKASFCVESLRHLNSHDIYTQLPWASKTVMPSLSANITKLDPCDLRKKNLVMYTGFFHQHPFARPFQDEFGSTGVISKPKNTIYEIIPKNKKGVYIQQLELKFLEKTAFEILFNVLEIDGVDKFIKRKNDFFNKYSQILKQFSPIPFLDLKTSWLIYSTKNYPDVSRPLMPQSSYLILTKPSRVDDQFLIQKLSENVSSLFEISNLQKNQDWAYKRVLSDANQTNPIIYSYGGFQAEVHPNSELIHFFRDNLLIVSEPHKSSIACYDLEPDLTGAKLRDCPF